MLATSSDCEAAQPRGLPPVLTVNHRTPRMLASHRTPRMLASTAVADLDHPGQPPVPLGRQFARPP